MRLDPKPHVGDTGLEFVVTIVDEDGAPVNVSAATEKLVYLTLPDGTVLTKTAAFDTNGTDGKIKYTTQGGDLSARGTWKIQAYVAGAGGFSGSSREATFEVFSSRHG
jgi:hypothetical protein